jgi:hypothetical protein
MNKNNTIEYRSFTIQVTVPYTAEDFDSIYFIVKKAESSLREHAQLLRKKYKGASFSCGSGFGSVLDYDTAFPPDEDFDNEEGE